MDALRRGVAEPSPIQRVSDRARMFEAVTLRPADRADDHSASYEANNFVVCDAWNSRGGPPVKLRAICFIFAYVWDAEENDLATHVCTPLVDRVTVCVAALQRIVDICIRVHCLVPFRCGPARAGWRKRGQVWAGLI